MLHCAGQVFFLLQTYDGTFPAAERMVEWLQEEDDEEEEEEPFIRHSSFLSWYNKVSASIKKNGCGLTDEEDPDVWGLQGCVGGESHLSWFYHNTQLVLDGSVKIPAEEESEISYSWPIKMNYYCTFSPAHKQPRDLLSETNVQGKHMRDLLL